MDNWEVLIYTSIGRACDNGWGGNSLSLHGPL